MSPTPVATEPVATVSEEGPGDPAPSGAGTESATRGSSAGRRHRLRSLLPAGGAYLGLSVVLWWHVWTTHPTSVTTCGCGDSSLFTWFLAWPAHAIAHGLDPWYSTAMFHPGGVNLLANTSEVGIGVVLAPVTWLFGPVATLNVALTLSPVLSALAMFVLLRRWVSWSPAAFTGGLLYGFSPLVLVSLTDAHLMLGLLVVPPLVVLCLDELLIRQRRRPVRMGVLLGLLAVAQFFIGTEVLVIMGVTAAVGIGLVVLYAAVVDRQVLRSHGRHALVGLGVAAGVAAVLLAYPVWFALDGPAHLSGLVWPTLPPGIDGIRLGSLIHLDATVASTANARRFGGYQGASLHQPQYLGLGCIMVLTAGTVVWRRDRRLWLFGVLGLVAVALSLSVVEFDGWVPWRWLRSLPVVQNVLPYRFMTTTLLCSAVMLGIIVDHCDRWVLDRGAATRSESSGRRWRPIVAGGVAAVVAVVALVPMAGADTDDLPLTAVPVVLPEWFTTVAPHLPPGQVILTYPSSYGGFQSLLTWQAVDGFRYDEMEGGGPGQVGARAGAEEIANRDLGRASLLLDPAIAYSPGTIAAVRAAIFHAGVTRVVIPDQPELPLYEQGFHPSYAVGLMTAALGSAPRMEASAWVWTPSASVPALTIAPSAFTSCVGPLARAPGAPEAVPDCLVAAAG